MAKNRKTPESPPAERSFGVLFPNLGGAGFWLTACVAAAVFLRPLFSGVTYPWSNTGFQIFLTAVFCVYILRVIAGRSGFRCGAAGAAAVGFLLWNGVSAAFSVYPAASLRELYSVYGCVLLFFLAVNVLRSDRKREIALNALFASSVVVSVYAVYQYFWGLDKTRLLVSLYHAEDYVPEFISRLGTQRAFSTFVYPPALAGFLTVVIPAAFGMCLREKRGVKKFALGGVLLLCAFALVLTYSKGGWLVLAAAGVFFAFLWMRYIKKSFHAGAFLGAFFLAAALAVIVFSGVERRATARRFAASYAVRYEYWLAAPGIISRYPLTGSGPGTWGAVYPEYKLLEAEYTQMAHNNYVQVASETGPAGLIFFLWFFLAAAASGFRCLARKDLPDSEKLLCAGVLTGIGAFLIQSLGEFTLYIPGVAATVFLFAGIINRPGGGAKAALSFRVKAVSSALVLAAALLLLVLLRKPMLADRYFEKSTAAAGRGEFISAGLLLDRAIGIFPAEARYYLHRGMLFERRPGFFAETAEMYEQAARLNPNSSQIHFRLARFLWGESSGRPGELRDKAVLHMERAVAGDPFSPLHRISLGRMYHLSGREEDAASQYRKAVEYESGERMSLRRKRLVEELEKVREWLGEIGEKP